jgi:hypothetical protein
MFVANAIHRGLMSNRYTQPELYPLLVSLPNILFVQSEIARGLSDLELYVSDADFVEISIELLSPWLAMPNNEYMSMSEALSRVNEHWVQSIIKRARVNANLSTNYQKVAVNQNFVARALDRPDSHVIARDSKKTLVYRHGFME